MKERSRLAAITCSSLVALSVLMLLWGCRPQPSGIGGTVEFELRVSKKARKQTAEQSSAAAKRPQDAPPLFIPAEGHKVRAHITLTGLEPGKQEVVHLAWLRPGGKEFFRKLVEFVPEEETKSLRSSIGISPDRERDPGKYALKVYRHRRLLTMGVFELGEPVDS